MVNTNGRFKKKKAISKLKVVRMELSDVKTSLKHLNPSICIASRSSSFFSEKDTGGITDSAYLTTCT